MSPRPGDAVPDPVPGAQAARWAGVLLWVVPALWSSNYVIARLSQGVVGPYALACGRWAVALALLLPFVGTGLWRRRAALVREWRQTLVLGVLGMVICGAWVYVGAASTSATNIALIYAATPVAIAVVGVKLLHERMSRAQSAAVGAALAGVVFVVVGGDLERLCALRFNPGDAWILACAVSWTAYSVLLKRWGSALSPAERLAAIVGAGLLVLLPAAAWEAATAAPPPLTAEAFALMLAGGVLPGALSYLAYSVLQREVGAARSALLLYLAPVYGAGLAWWLLGERPGWHHLAGAALILPSIWLATRRA